MKSSTSRRTLIERQKLDSIIQEMYVAGTAGEDKAPETLEWLERLFKALFQDSGYPKWVKHTAN